VVSSSEQETLLLVEDEVLIRVAIAAYLRGCGYRVSEAADADEAITLLQEFPVKVHLVLCDVQMSQGMGGRVVAPDQSTAMPNEKIDGRQAFP
jgi:CheY-like chemotaxis protein